MGLGRLPYISEKVGRVAIYVSLPDNVDKLTAWLGKVVVDPLLNTVQNDTACWNDPGCLSMDGVEVNFRITICAGAKKLI